MPLTLTREQQDFMRNGTKVNNLAAWTLRSGNHIAVSVRQAANLTQSAAPTRRDTQHMVDYLSGGSISDSDLVRLINGFNYGVR
ncbi:MAG TPA: hypothetical protein VJM46_05360 [Candidatus Saccharimonadales bacterium]|nr:hypothetical protein [Candidatus Saccharimonadales bacterium]